MHTAWLLPGLIILQLQLTWQSFPQQQNMARIYMERKFNQ